MFFVELICFSRAQLVLYIIHFLKKKFCSPPQTFYRAIHPPRFWAREGSPEIVTDCYIEQWSAPCAHAGRLCALTGHAALALALVTARASAVPWLKFAGQHLRAQLVQFFWGGYKLRAQLLLNCVLRTQLALLIYISIRHQ